VLPEEKTERALKLLNKDVYNIQQKINKLLKMRPVPKIKFAENKELIKAGKIEELLATLKKNQK